MSGRCAMNFINHFVYHCTLLILQFSYSYAKSTDLVFVVSGSKGFLGGSAQRRQHITGLVTDVLRNLNELALTALHTQREKSGLKVGLFVGQFVLPECTQEQITDGCPPGKNKYQSATQDFVGLENWEMIAQSFNRISANLPEARERDPFKGLYGGIHHYQSLSRAKKPGVQRIFVFLGGHDASVREWQFVRKELEPPGNRTSSNHITMSFQESGETHLQQDEFCKLVFAKGHCFIQDELKADDVAKQIWDRVAREILPAPTTKEVEKSTSQAAVLSVSSSPASAPNSSSGQQNATSTTSATFPINQTQGSHGSAKNENSLVPSSDKNSTRESILVKPVDQDPSFEPQTEPRSSPDSLSSAQNLPNTAANPVKTSHNDGLSFTDSLVGSERPIFKADHNQAPNPPPSDDHEEDEKGDFVNTLEGLSPWWLMAIPAVLCVGVLSFLIMLATLRALSRRHHQEYDVENAQVPPSESDETYNLNKDESCENVKLKDRQARSSVSYDSFMRMSHEVEAYAEKNPSQTSVAAAETLTSASAVVDPSAPEAQEVAIQHQKPAQVPAETTNASNVNVSSGSGSEVVVRKPKPKAVFDPSLISQRVSDVIEKKKFQMDEKKVP